MVENPILPENDQGEENLPPTTPGSEKANQAPALLVSRPFGKRIRKVHD